MQIVIENGNFIVYGLESIPKSFCKHQNPCWL